MSTETVVGILRQVHSEDGTLQDVLDQLVTGDKQHYQTPWELRRRIEEAEDLDNDVKAECLGWIDDLKKRDPK